MKFLNCKLLATLCCTIPFYTAQAEDIDDIKRQAMLNAYDSAMVFPESIEDIDTIDYDWTERHFIHIDPNCISDAEWPFVPDSEYIEKLKAIPSIIELPFNQPVRECLDLYIHRRREMVERMVGVGYNHYFPIFEDALRRYDMPSELKYLACIESGLRQNAYSRAGAAGLWQFMPSTGLLQGLEINSYIDERYDLYKSTDAACRYLLQLYGTFQDWPLAIAAYNCGPGNVSKAIARSGGRRSFWEIYHFLPRETRSYFPIFVAATYIMNYHCDYNLCATVAEIPPVCDTIMLDQMVHFEQIARFVNMPVKQIESLNPQFIYDIVPGSSIKSFALTLPQEKALEFIELQDSIFAFKADSLLPHNGDLRLIQNKGQHNSYIKGGGRKGRKGKAAIGTDGNAKYHKVRRGQTLSYIARKYGTSVNKIKSLNGLNGNNIRVGQRLRVR